MAFAFNFPKYRKIPCNRKERIAQAKHIRQEARETVHEAVSDDEFAMLVEAMDTIHAAETLLRPYPQKVLDEAQMQVFIKNHNRGYYSHVTSEPVTASRQ